MLNSIFISFIFLIIPLFSFANNWTHTTHTDEMTGKKQDISYANADYPNDVTIHIRQTSWEKEVYLSTNKYVKHVKVIYVRFGNGKVQTYAISSSNRKTMYISDADNFLRNMKKNRFLAVRFIPNSEEPVTAKFSLIGYSNSFHNRPIYNNTKNQNQKAAMAWNRKVDKERGYSNDSSNSAESYVPKKEDNPDNYKGQAELKLDGLHAYGIKSIKKFKGNKLIIQAANGTFAIPKDKLEKAEKINFSVELNIDN